MSLIPIKFNITILSIMMLSRMTLKIMTLNIMTLRIMILSIMTLSEGMFRQSNAFSISIVALSK